jgi:alkylhydroperoxidase/carboxymuconolactone decarboxylase family protein YurZ
MSSSSNLHGAVPNVDLAAAYVSSDVADAVRRLNPVFFDRVAAFWAVGFRGGSLEPKVKELVSLGIHAAATTLNEEGMRTHVAGALAAGATVNEILDVFISLTPQGTHSFSLIPVLLEETGDVRDDGSENLPPITDEVQEIKEQYVRERGYWTEHRERLARLVPAFARISNELSLESWRTGALDGKTRELIFIAANASVNHMYEFGMRVHVQNALKHGATREEIMEVLVLTAMLGVRTWVSGTQALMEVLETTQGAAVT